MLKQIKSDKYKKHYQIPIQPCNNGLIDNKLLRLICYPYKTRHYLSTYKWLFCWNFFLQGFFLPLSNTIVTCFKDDSIFAWDSESLQCKYQLPIPPEDGKSPHYRALATPRDGHVLVAGGRWNIYSFVFIVHILSYSIARLVPMQII
jgi:WD40 repeat protein